MFPSCSSAPPVPSPLPQSTWLCAILIGSGSVSEGFHTLRVVLPDQLQIVHLPDSSWLSRTMPSLIPELILFLIQPVTMLILLFFFFSCPATFYHCLMFCWAWILVPAPLLTCCVGLGKLLPLPELQLLHQEY